ncbi:MAG TPA: GGDEF domain-containing protein [Acidimicrobiales bacterium]|nr:GGDEF domain-containing protein [Acidimicrobiales bacterium]
MARRDEGLAPSALAPMQGVAPVAIIDFLANAEAVVDRLGHHTGVDDWVLTRHLGDEWVVLAGHGGHGYRPGDVLERPVGVAQHLGAMAASWTGDVVVDLTSDAVGREERAGDVPPLPGVVPFPLWAGEGLFGAVCALPASAEQEASLRDAAEMVRLTVELLTSVLDLDLDRSRLQRQLDAAESAALSDALTGLGNRRAFDRAIEREEARCARFGHLAGVVVLDLDGLKTTNDTWGHEAGDDLIRRAGESIRRTLRTADQAFRTGGDEFALLLPEIGADGLETLCGRLCEALAEEGVSASIGSALRRPAGNLHAVAREADAQMYERKRERTGRT